MSARKVITRTGKVLSKTFSPPNRPPVYGVRLQDAWGIMQVKWLGRQEVPGIDLGVTLKVSGIPVSGEDGETLINPDYQLMKGTS